MIPLLQLDKHIYTSLLETTSNIIIAISRDYTILEWNRQAEILFGYKKDEVFGKNYFDTFIQPDKRELFIETTNVIFAGETSTDIISDPTYLVNVNKYLTWNITPLFVDNEIEGLIATGQDITQQYSYEVLLKSSEQNFKSLYENAPLAYQSLDINGNFITVNKKWCEQLGYTYEEVKGKNFTEFMTPESAKLVASRFPNFVKTGSIKDYEFEMVRKDGSKFIVSYDGKIGYDIFGNFKQTHCMFIDVTEKKSVQEQLLHQGTLIDNVSDAIISFDTNLKITSVNKALTNLTGYDSSYFLNKNIYSMFRFKPYETSLQQIRQNLLTRGSWKGEIAISTFGSKHIDTEVSLSPLNDIEGNKKGYVAIVRDITERRKYENRLKMLSKAVENSSTSIVITDVQGNIEYVNKKFLERTGYSLGEVLGTNPSIVKSNLTNTVVYDNLWKTIINGNDWQGELQNKKKNGELFWELTSISPIRDRNGNITHFVSIKDDITERKKLFDEIIKAKDKAEELNRIKTHFLSTISHELRTPMVGILGFADILASEVEEDFLKDMANTILKSGNRLMDTLNLILDLSKIEANKSEIEFNIENISKLVEEQTIKYEEAAAEKKLTLKTIINNNELNSNIDKKLFKNVLGNLLNNAIKFTNNGHVTVVVDKHNDCDKNFAVVKVKDTGIGIPEGSKDLIFEEFRQVSEGLSRSFEGTGLGLTVTKKYVSLMNGDISVESQVGNGSTFTVRFPLIKEDRLK